MDLLLFLMIFPSIVAAILLLVKSDRVRNVIVIPAAAIIMVASIWTAAKYLDGGAVFFELESELINQLMTVCEVALCLVIVYLGYKYKRYTAPILSIIQTGFLLWYELTVADNVSVSHSLYIDQLSIVMLLIIGIIGSLITIYALGYMRDFQKHSTDDRRNWFFFLMFVFLSAMFGIVFSNNIVWMFFFWEITTLCSFALIGYTRTEEAIKNSFKQVTLNLIGGIAFICAIIVLGSQYNIMELDVLLSMDKGAGYVMLAVALLSLAGIVKAAQMPFHSWLLGAMVAPTPTSALLHSSTMVKAGVFIILKLSPMYGNNYVGYMVMAIGGITFLLASMAAISQSNAKRVLAYSTIANLGLIVACGGVGSYEAVWAGVMLLIFHAVTKSLLFLCVGTAEHNIGSRNIEDMDGLFTRMPKLAALMIIGIAGMFLAPFGMLISKWAAMTAFVNSENIILIVSICFGSAVTAFYWGKWLGKLVAIVANQKNVEKDVHKEEWTVLGVLAASVIAICFAFPAISRFIVSPYLLSVFGVPIDPILSTFGTGYVIVVLAMLAILIALFVSLFNRSERLEKTNYMCGVNTGDNLSFASAMGENVNVSLRNWYMEGWFGEERIDKIGLAITVLTLVIAFGAMVGGVL